MRFQAQFVHYIINRALAYFFWALATMPVSVAANSAVFTEIPAMQSEIHANKLGATVGLPVALYKNDIQSILLLPAIATGNFDMAEGVPWQMWAGQIGLAYQHIIFSHQLKFRTGFIHRSEHVSDLPRYQEKYLRAGVYFDNRSLRSFEYLFVSVDRTANLVGGWSLDLTLRLRAFTPPLNSYAPYSLRAASGIYAGFSRSLSENISVWWGAFTDYLVENYHQKLDVYTEAYRNPVRMTTGLETGLTVNLPENNQVSLVVGYRDSAAPLFAFTENLWGGFVRLGIAKNTGTNN